MLNVLRKAYHYYQLPPSAKKAMAEDRKGLSATDPGPQRVVEEGIAWLMRAQQNSATNDGGVARHYGVMDGWSPSYPETTGYIVPTMLDYARATGSETVRESGVKMLDWLVGIQFPEGGFQGGMINQTPVVPVTFNTGQILIGLASGVEHFGDKYREPMNKAAQWLMDVQDEDGCWRKTPTPFADPGVKAYETHVAWGLLEAARQTTDRGFGEAGLKNVDWALTNQKSNGWFENCCLDDIENPLTHTLGYVLRGILEAHRFSGEAKYLEAALPTADALLGNVKADGKLPGRYDSNWRPAVSWVCLTGAVQVAHCWMMIFKETGEKRYLEAARSVNAYVRRTISIDGPEATRGAVRGSFPINGHYGRFQYLNWACKFMIDANLLEIELAGK